MKLGKVPNNLTPYDDNYKEICFVAWYKSGRPNGEKFLAAVPVDKDGRKPHLVHLNEWRSLQNWDLRADVMDTEVARQIEKRAIEEKVEMFTRHAALGKDLQERGMEFFDTHGIEKDSTALKMIISGVEMEKVSRGLPDALMAISEMQDDDLKGLVGKLLQHFDPNETNINVNDLEKISSQIIEGTFKDVPEDADQ
jgi:hypothetical protein